MRRPFAAATLLAVALSLVAVAASAAPAPREPAPGSMMVKMGPGDWRPVDNLLLPKATQAPATPAIPFLFFDEAGRLTLSRIEVSGASLSGLFLKDGLCNGGSCSPGGGGPAINCPTSGGPTCGSGQSCVCECVSGGGTTSTHNICQGKGGGEEPPLLD